MSISREQTQEKINQMAAGALAHTPEQNYTVADRFEEWAANTPDRLFLHEIDSSRQISYRELNETANQYAHLAYQRGIRCGDVVAIMLHNRAEFFCAWLGMAKIGAISALLNTHAREKVLEHAISATDAKLLIVGEECLDNVRSAVVDVETLIVPEVLDSKGQIDGDISPELMQQSRENPPQKYRESLNGESTLFYVFTSGTTGLPKAARLSHMRWLSAGDAWKSLLETNGNDVFYSVLPLFHMAGGMSLVSHAIAAGGSIVLRRKFSASRFWDDVREHKVTTAQYIGEICRYLVNQPPRDNDRDHSLKYLTGAGMGADVWRKFLNRFGEIGIYEGYGGTETNCNMTNVDGKIGSCGRIPFKDRSNARLLRYDLENQCLALGDDGRPIECQPGEVGELAGMILNIPGVGAGRFEGYTSAEATEKKILRNAFVDGDAWFLSGDLFTRDEEDYYYFVDRVGDTFRWKSENVSTMEVAEVLAEYDAAELINVYGVEVPDHEGRAGMAAVQLKAGRSFDGKVFYEVAQTLPHYARPLFVRVSAQADITATFKLRKVDLQRQGYQPRAVKEPLYLLDERNACYTPYSEEALANLGVKPG